MDKSLVSHDPEIMSGALCFTGTRVPVQNLFDYLEVSSSLEGFIEDFPSISRERAVAVLEAAKDRLFADAPAALRVRAIQASQSAADTQRPDNRRNGLVWRQKREVACPCCRSCPHSNFNCRC